MVLETIKVPVIIPYSVIYDPLANEFTRIPIKYVTSECIQWKQNHITNSSCSPMSTAAVCNSSDTDSA